MKFISSYLGTLVLWSLLLNCAFAQDYTHLSAWQSGSITSAVGPKNSSTKWYGTYGINKSHCRRYLKVFNKKSADVKLGTDKPVITYELVPQSTKWFPREIETLLEKGMSLACTKKEGATDTNIVPVNECFATVVYK